MLVSFLLWLIPTILDTVVQVTNSVVVNRIAQGEKHRIELFQGFRESSLIVDGGLYYPPALCCIADENTTATLEAAVEAISTTTISTTTEIPIPEGDL